MNPSRNSVIPVWTANRGTMMMIRVALTQVGRTPSFASSFDELLKLTEQESASCVIVGLDELSAAGMTAASAARRFGPSVFAVLLASGTATVDAAGLRARVLKVPFAAADLKKAVESDPGRQVDMPSVPDHRPPSDLTEIVRAEIDRIVKERAEAMVADAVMRIVPELAEAIIKSELQRLLDEEGRKAVSQDPAVDGDEQS